MAERIIPGVSVTVVKEVLPQQLSPSGVLGLIGFIENEGTEVRRVSSWARFVDKEGCGPASAYSLPEARQALDNGVYQLVICPLDKEKGTPARVGIPLVAAPNTGTTEKDPKLSIEARVPGSWANGTTVAIAYRDGVDKSQVFDVTIKGPGGIEEKFRGLGATTLVETINTSKIVKVCLIPPVPVNTPEWPAPNQSYTLAGGTGPDGARAACMIPKLKLSADDKLTKEVITAAVPDSAITAFTVVARDAGEKGNGIKVAIAYETGDATFAMTIKPDSTPTNDETHSGLTPSTLADKLKDSKLVTVHVGPKVWPAPSTYPLKDGADANPDAYADALKRLEEESDVDMVIASVSPSTDATTLKKIYDSVIAHCNKMSTDCKGRIGFGQVPSLLPDRIVTWTNLASNLVSDRFVLVAPNGVVGAVAGRVGGLPYFHSPTFKTVTGTGELTPIVREDQETLLKAKVVPVVLQRGKGVIILRGLTTDEDQISVRRVADRAVRLMKMVGDLFIGLLNNADGRAALKQKLVAELIQMEKDGAIVPSTDGKGPAFSVNVDSSQSDFAEGIVRVNMAVRPVRAIDYIYANIMIQN